MAKLEDVILRTVAAGRPAAGVTGRLHYATDTKTWSRDNGATWDDNVTPVVSVNGATGVVVLVKADVGLSNVDNTSDANKPISTATQSALDLKEGVQTAASQAEAEAGTQVAIRSWSPLRVAQAIVALADTPANLALTQVTETVTTPSISANVVTIDLTAGTYFAVTLNANITSFTISNPVAARVNAFTLSLIQDATGSRTVAWTFTGKTLKWAGASAPTQTATANKEDVYSFVSYDGGTTWYGFVGGQNY